MLISSRQRANFACVRKRARAEFSRRNVAMPCPFKVMNYPQQIPQGLCVGFVTRDGDEEVHYARLRDGRIRMCRVTAPTVHFFKNRNGSAPASIDWTPAVDPDATYVGHYPESFVA